MSNDYQRWNFHHRFQHLLLFVSFFILTFTGLPIKYAYKPWAPYVTKLFGGFDTMFIIHKIAAVIMIIFAVYHLTYLAYCWLVKKEVSDAMWPRIKDVTDLLDNIVYNLGLSKKPPQFDRYSYKEKFDYWAVFWGIAIMVGSGLILWFPHISGVLLPRWVMDCAQVAHSDEAMLAIMAVFVWHFYNAHFSPTVFPMSKVWLYGKTTNAEMQEFHPLEYKRVTGEEAITAQAPYKPMVESKYRNSLPLIITLMVIYAIILVWFLIGFLPLGLM